MTISKKFEKNRLNYSLIKINSSNKSNSNKIIFKKDDLIDLYDESINLLNKQKEENSQLIKEKNELKKKYENYKFFYYFFFFEIIVLWLIICMMI